MRPSCLIRNDLPDSDNDYGGTKPVTKKQTNIKMTRNYRAYVESTCFGFQFMIC